MAYSEYQTLKLYRPEPGILEIVMGQPGKLAVADAQGHRELTEIWGLILLCCRQPNRLPNFGR